MQSASGRTDLARSRRGDSGVAPTGDRRPLVVELGYEYIHPGNLDPAILEDALAALARLELTGNVRVVITSQMATSLADRVDSTYSSPFRQERIIGRVIAKTVTDKSSSTEMLVDAVALQPDVRAHVAISLPRLLRHEGYHLLLRERGEDAHSVIRSLNPASEEDKAFLWIAALAIEEYRVERALCEEGSFASESYDEQMPSVLHDCYQALELASARWGTGVGEDVLDLTNEIVTKCAYVAGAHHAGRRLAGETLKTPAWCALVGPIWPMFLRLTENIPTAPSLLDGAEMAKRVCDVAALVEVWCQHIGFELKSDEDGLYLWPRNLDAAARPAA